MTQANSSEVKIEVIVEKRGDRVHRQSHITAKLWKGNGVQQFLALPLRIDAVSVKVTAQLKGILGATAAGNPENVSFTQWRSVRLLPEGMPGELFCKLFQAVAATI